MKYNSGCNRGICDIGKSSNPPGAGLTVKPMNWSIKGVPPSNSQPHVNWASSGSNPHSTHAVSSQHIRYHGHDKHHPHLPGKISYGLSSSSSSPHVNQMQNHKELPRKYNQSEILGKDGNTTKHNVPLWGWYQSWGSTNEEVINIIDFCQQQQKIWGINALDHYESDPGRGDACKIKAIILSNCRLNHGDCSALQKALQGLNLNLDILDLSGNRIDIHGTPCVLYGITRIGSPETLKYVKYINLSNNRMNDKDAKYIADALADGMLPATKHINLSGNNITEVGETQIVKALKGKMQDIIVLTQRLETHAKWFIGYGTREEKIAAFKEFIQKAKEKGIDTDRIVVDHSFWGNTSNQLSAVKSGVVGFVKCNWAPEDVVKGHAQDKIIARVSKTLSKVVGSVTNVEGIVSCYLQATDDAWTSEAGLSAVNHELCVMGEQDFCD